MAAGGRHGQPVGKSDGFQHCALCIVHWQTGKLANWQTGKLANWQSGEGWLVPTLLFSSFFPFQTIGYI